MQIEITIEYHEKDIPSGTSPYSRKENIKVRIPEVSLDDAPLAFLVHHCKDRAIEVRLHKSQLYKEARISYYNGKKTKEYPIDEIPWNRVLHKYSPFGGYSSKAEYIAFLKVAVREYLIVGNVVYRRCNEPYYHITNTAYKNRRTVIFPEFSDKSKKIMSGYSALDKETAIQDAIALAKKRGDANNMEDIKRMPHGHIDVLIPHACKRKFKRQI